MARHILIAATAAALLAVGAASATAYRLAISRGGEISLSSTEAIEFGSEPWIACNLTFTGTLATSVELVEGTQIGSTSNVSVRNCAWSSLSTALQMKLAGVEGTAPDDLTALRIEIEDFTWSVPVWMGFVNCLYRGTFAFQVELVDTGTNSYDLGAVYALDEVQLPFERGSFLCLSEIAFRGELTLSPAQTLTVS